MNVLSLFDGMSCGQITLKELGVKVDNYFAAEIDKHAIQVTKHNFPNTIHLGDVTKVSSSELPKIDLLMGGSPCQGFSFAGKQLAFDDPRSKLFFEFVRLKEELNPKYFLLENVRMAKEHENVITRFMGVEPIYINSALLSAQSRPRVYWTNINAHPSGLFGDLKCLIPQPKDKGVLLRDILETDVPEKYYLSDKMLNYFSKRAANFNGGKVNIRNNEDKASCLTSSMASCDISDNFIKIDTNLNVAKNQDKANCFTAGGNSGGLHSDMNLIVASRGRDSAVLTPKRTEYGKQIRKDYEAGLIKEQRKNIQQLEPRLDGKTNCLTSVQKDNLVMQLNERQKANYKNESEKANCMLSTMYKGSQANGMTLVGNARIRRLTPTECKRLQTVPDWYDMSVVSDTQQYKMLGNGWTVEVIKYILNFAS
jgi:DNA-cytosine methyltransferase